MSEPSIHSYKIKKLPDSIANQIAAGEVVQRPASVVKELVENSIDAGATQVDVYVQDAGITEIRIIDNGCGMNRIDAHTAFERHATSKISSVEDIFKIATKGFRGEALPSIASVSKMVLKTKPEEEDIGVMIRNEGSKIVEQDACAIPTGTDIQVKHLFFNTPARKKFLKSPHIEIKHIIQELQHIAMAHAEVGFSLHDGKKVLFKYASESSIKRVMQVLGKKNYEDKLLPIEMETDVATIKGYIGIPQSAKKTRGDQYLFVNSRFIKHGYFHHAISSGFEGLLEDKAHPSYCLFMQVDPSRIDVNIHPTKQEVKFEDERIIYTYLKAAVRECLSKFAVAPSIDFDAANSQANFEELIKTKEGDTGFSRLMQQFGGKVENSKGFQTSQFGSGKAWKGYHDNLDTLWKPTESRQSISPDEDAPMEEIGNLPSTVNIETGEITSGNIETFDSKANSEDVTESTFPAQIMRKYILTAIKSGLILVNQHAAHCRILYERYLEAIAGKPFPTQGEMFPQTLELSPEEAVCMEHIAEDIKRFGFLIEPFGQNTFIIQGTPSGLEYITPVELLKKVLDESLHDHGGKPSVEIVAAQMAKFSSVKVGQALNKAQCTSILDDLFACHEQFLDPFGNRTFIRLSGDYIAQLFQKSLV